MSDTMDDVRAHIAELRHERGECDWNCQYCEEEQLEQVDNCTLCSQPIYRGNVCRGCWDESHA